VDQDGDSYSCPVGYYCGSNWYFDEATSASYARFADPAGLIMPEDLYTAGLAWGFVSFDDIPNAWITLFQVGFR
jgi:hypothetical protein